MTPRTQRPGYAAEGQHFCRVHKYDPETRKVTGICGKPVPVGEIPYLAWNSTQGHYLAVCLEHREELARLVEEWFSTSLGSAKLLADLLTLPSGELVSDTEVREILTRKGDRKIGQRGPLSEDDRKRGLALLAQERTTGT